MTFISIFSCVLYVIIIPVCFLMTFISIFSCVLYVIIIPVFFLMTFISIFSCILYVITIPVWLSLALYTFRGAYLSRDITKPTMNNQSLRCPHEESLGPQLPIKRTAKTLIRLGGCPGCSESSLGAQSLCWFLSCRGSFITTCINAEFHSQKFLCESQWDNSKFHTEFETSWRKFYYWFFIARVLNCFMWCSFTCCWVVVLVKHIG